MPTKKQTSHRVLYEVVAVKDYIIKGGKLVTSSGLVDNNGLLIMRGRIALPGAMRPESLYSGFACTLYPGSRSIVQFPRASADPESYELIDATGLYIAPGFIDLHVHGGSGFDVMDASARALREMARYHASGGTTSFLPTVSASSPAQMIKALQAIAALSQRHTGGAMILGAHLEGPFLNPASAGALDKNQLRHPDIKEMESLLSTAEGNLRMITLAPELPGIREIIRMNTREGVVVAVGHSRANYEETIQAIKYGVRYAVHTFNATIPMHHRDPGLLGAVLTAPEVVTEAIADNYHLHPAMLQFLLSIKGKRGATLATDAIRAAGMSDGTYKFAGRQITVHNGKTSTPGGTLAGSTITMAQAVRNAVRFGNISLPDAVRMASANPARVLGLEDQKGSLAPGMDADIVLLDEDLEVRLVMVQGEIVVDRRKQYMQAESK